MVKRVGNVHINESFLQLKLDINKPLNAAGSLYNKDSFSPPTAAFDVNQQNGFHNQLESLAALTKEAAHSPFLPLMKIPSQLPTAKPSALIPFSSVVAKSITAMKIIKQ